MDGIGMACVSGVGTRQLKKTSQRWVSFED